MPKYVHHQYFRLFVCMWKERSNRILWISMMVFRRERKRTRSVNGIVWLNTRQKPLRLLYGHNGIECVYVWRWYDKYGITNSLEASSVSNMHNGGKSLSWNPIYDIGSFVSLCICSYVLVYESNCICYVIRFKLLSLCNKNKSRYALMLRFRSRFTILHAVNLVYKYQRERC